MIDTLQTMSGRRQFEDRMPTLSVLPLAAAVGLLFVLPAGSSGLTAGQNGTREPAKIGPARRNEDGVLVHRVESPYQSQATEIRVLLPDADGSAGRFAVVYLLPVEAGREARYGDALTEVLNRNLHNRHRVICVQPTFSQLPWYADHPTNRGVRQESHFVEVVVPFVDSHYPTLNRKEGRLLVGFSKSGWGALCLLMRHPQSFGTAAAWDAPLMMDRPGRFGSGAIFGTGENFQRYHLSRLMVDRADQFRNATRLAILGYGGFRDDHRQAHALLEKLGVSHLDRDGPERKHDWHSGWLAEAFEFVAPVSSAETSKAP